MASYPPGSSEWWLERLGRSLLDAQPVYDKQWNWYVGNPPVPRGYRRYRTLMRMLQKMARNNYMALVVDSPIERMAIEGFRLRGASETDEWLSEVWEYNELDLGSKQAHLESSIFGIGYTMVTPAEDGEEFPTITIEDPRTTFVEMDPAHPGKGLAGIRRFVDSVDGVAYSLIYTDESWHQYASDDKAIVSLNRDLWTDEEARRANNPQRWELLDEGDNPLGEMPISRLLWRPTRGDLSRSEMDGLYDIAERINNTMLDRLIIQKASAYKQRWAAGITVKKDGENGGKPPFDPGADILWATDKSDAKFGEFSESDIRQVLDAVSADVRDLAAISKTPPHYLLATITNVSGDALKAAETGLVSKTWDRMHSVEPGWKRTARLALLAAGKDATGRIEVDWADPESRSKAELADAALKESTIGVPFSLLLEKLGYTPEQIKQAKTERDEEETRKLMLDAQRAEVMAKFAPQPAAPGAKPGSKKSDAGANVRPAKGQPNSAQKAQQKPVKP